MRARTGAARLALALAVLPAASARAAKPPPPIEVSAAPPMTSGVDIAAAPAASQTLTGDSLAPDGTPDPLAALNQQAAGVSLQNAAGNPYQPNLVYHGFDLSSLQGTPQGLAVYVNGLRFNQAFGDTLDWELLAPMAIAGITVEDANPAFGLNALGGALVVRMKDGFGYAGGVAELSGGSFGRVDAETEYGRRAGNWAVYGAASVRHEAGWRDDQSSDIQDFYGDLAAHLPGTRFHLSLIAGHAALNGPGTAPVQLIAADPAAQYTAPNFIGNQYARLSARLDRAMGSHDTLHAAAYYDYFHQRVANGNAPNDLPCAADPSLLCQDGGIGPPSTTAGGATIPAFGVGSYYSELDRQTTVTNGYGANLILTDRRAPWGRRNRLVAGFDFDGAETGFQGSSLIGGITPLSRVFVGPGVLIDEPGTNIPVSVAVDTAAWGAYLADTIHLTHRLAVSASVRANLAVVDMTDRGGGDLSGYHSFLHLNPALGASYQLTPLLRIYAGYSEANRAPTPAELSCAGPTNACSLANFFVADPSLKQVVAHRWEAGLAGEALLPHGTSLRYDFDVYRTMLSDDIAFITSPTLGRAYFANIGQVLREGVDLGLHLDTGRLRAWLLYSHVLASYQNGFVEAAGGNPYADAAGNITVLPGDRLPGIAADTLRIGFDWQATDKLSIGLSALAVGPSYLYGDAANLDKPLPGYVVLNLIGRYRITPTVELFGSVENLTDQRYYTYGSYTQLGSVAVAQAPDLTNPRSYSVAAPIGGFVGLRVRFR
ncbi:MAG: TonB-dependent receptor [Acetobacteraceae bacterium]